MRYAVFSDIHSNLEAYKTFLEDSEKEEVEGYLCVGDIVGYGADPRECIELTKELNCPIVCGNHDWAASSKMGVDYFNYNAKMAILWTQDRLDDVDKNYLGSLKTVYHADKFTLVHGSLDLPEQFGYVLDVRQALKNMDLQTTPLCFIGHSHVAGVFYEDEDRYIRYTAKAELSLAKQRRYLINVGSIGQPRDGDWRSSYCIYDNKKSILRFKRIEYDLKRAQDKILDAGLPSSLAVRLGRGR